MTFLPLAAYFFGGVIFKSCLLLIVVPMSLYQEGSKERREHKYETSNSFSF